MTKKQLKLKKEAVETKIDKKKLYTREAERAVYDKTIKSLSGVIDKKNVEISSLNEKVAQEQSQRISEELHNAAVASIQRNAIYEERFDLNIFIASTIIFAVLFLISIL